MSVNPDKLFDVAQRLLDEIGSFFDEVGPQYQLPERRFVCQGPPAFDCDQLAVQYEGLRPGLTDTTDAGPLICNKPRSAELAVWLTRCVEVSEEPSKPEDLTDSAHLFMTDAWLLSEAVMLRHDAIAAEDPTLSLRLSPGRVEARGPEGGVAGNLMRLTVEVM